MSWLCLSLLIKTIVIRETVSSPAARVKSVSEQAWLILVALSVTCQCKYTVLSHHHLHPLLMLSPVSSTLGHIPSRSSSVRDWPDGRQRQREELHRQAAGGFGCRPDRLWQAGPRGVPARHCSLSQSAGRIWVRWGNRCVLRTGWATVRDDTSHTIGLLWWNIGRWCTFALFFLNIAYN